VSDHRRNLELKVRVTETDLEHLERRLASLTCSPIERLDQVDTYFEVPRGRLKLRELRDANGALVRAELIAYARPDLTGSRWSQYEVIPIPGTDAPFVLRALRMTHDELVRVAKSRAVGLIGHTRVHLDRVEGLGAFVELETVSTSQPETDADAEHRQVIAALGLDRFPVVSGSYSDLIRHQGNQARPE
jgi:adenylate cyclase